MSCDFHAVLAQLNRYCKIPSVVLSKTSEVHLLLSRYILMILISTTREASKTHADVTYKTVEFHHCNCSHFVCSMSRTRLNVYGW